MISSWCGIGLTVINTVSDYSEAPAGSLTGNLTQFETGAELSGHLMRILVPPIVTSRSTVTKLTDVGKTGTSPEIALCGDTCKTAVARFGVKVCFVQWSHGCGNATPPVGFTSASTIGQMCPAHICPRTKMGVLARTFVDVFNDMVPTLVAIIAAMFMLVGAFMAWRRWRRQLGQGFRSLNTGYSAMPDAVVEPSAEIIAQLERMGFSHADSEHASVAVGNSSMEVAMDWALAHSQDVDFGVPLMPSRDATDRQGD